MDKLINSLKVTLGTAFNLYLRAHACHWNVEGIHFPELHHLFEQIYQDLWNSVDDIAEQIRQLDAYAPSSMERMIELSRVKSNNEVMAAHDMLIMLLQDMETLMATLTEAFHLASNENKQGLANFLAERVESFSKWRWMLRATAKRVS